ncbi:DUF4767 domain-containing protein [Lactobacillus sp. CBA3606]|uniref:DUF4767 domain-containing protein n=1 Tax=Lactobacillus sp. CBA3606 TaxID=2099789 RepID=UPI000CFCEB84|nr:DUF4767 domain-containing protein [Lactobacillus sp. CBA3606]AVK64694.1 DUF4767 domain-containing protein [Lactobacillus sp. CBA3606]
MKKLWYVSLASTVLLTGCATKNSQQAAKSASSSVTTVKKTTTKTSQSVGKSATGAKKVASTLWNTTKASALSTFMHHWQATMGQTYQGTYDGANPDHLGYIFPKAITSGELAGRVSWGNQPIELTWSQDGENGKSFQIVAVATGGKPKTMFPTSYLFCLHNQRPVVFMSRTTNGDTFYLQDTQNSALQAGFAEIVTGSRPTVQDSATLNADVSAAVQAKPQRWPSNYQGIWYYYEAYTKRVETVENNRISEVKLNYFDTGTPKFLNVLGATQTAGDGEFDYVRYQYYDGRQIPVMMMASGAEMWFDNNAYRDKAIAAQLRGLQFGDETASR